MVFRRFAGLTVALLALVAPVAVTSAAHAAPTDGLVAWYPLDETSGTVAVDASGNGRHGTVEGTATWLEGNGFRFGGGSASSGNAIKLPNNITAGLASITVALDVWVDPALTGNHFVYNLGNLAVGSPQSGTGYLFTTTTPYRSVISNAAWSNEQVTSKGSNLAKGTWKHLTYTQTGTVGTLFENGVQVAQKTNVAYTPAQIGNGITTRNYLGRSAYAADNSFMGVVRDFRIYDRALAASEVVELTTASHTALVAADAAWVESALGDVSSVTANVTLPVRGPARAGINWASSNTAVIAANGTVTRPTDDTVVDLTATVAIEGITQTRVIPVTVKGVANPDLAAVETAADQLAVDGIDDVRGNLTLPTDGGNGVAVTWSSSDDGVIDASGIVHRPAHGEPAATVELTATLRKGVASVEKPFTATVSALPAQVEPEAYLFSYFTGDNIAGEKIYFGASNGNNAQDWLTLNGGQPVLSSTQGTTGLRDPFIIRSPEGDRFYMIATDLSIGGGTSWDASQRTGSKYIEVWESTDLVNWTDQRHVKVSPDTAGNTWAPEAYYDESIGAYVVFWASKLYAESDPNHTGNTYNRMLFATTRDFRTFSEPQVWQDTGVSRIDSTVIKVGDAYHRFTKDEASVTGCLDILEEASTDLRAVTTTTSPTGAWALQDTCIGKNAGTGAVEGPSIFAANPGDVNGPGYYLFVDEFSGRKYIPLASDELGANADWKVPANYQLPSPAPRHGTVLPISAEEYQRVLQAYLPAATGADTVRVTTPVGSEATLPSKVSVNFADGSSRSVAVDWEEPPAGYADQPGEVEVQGTIAGFALTGTAVIRVISATGDLRLHYDFSLVDGTRVPDSSPYGNDGVIRGTGANVTGNVLTLPGGAASSGSAYVQLPTGMFDGRDTLTISTWLKNETAAGNYAAMFFGTTQNLPSQYWLLNPRNPQGRYKSVVTNGLNSGAPWGTEYGISPTNSAQGIAGPLTSSAWGLYTTVIEPGSITAYYNGDLIGRVATTRTVSQFGSNLVAYLGKSSYPDAFYKGGIRDVKVYTTARTAAEIAGEYFAGVDDPAAVLAALEADAAALELGPNPIAADLDLPVLGEHGSAIAWSSSDAQVIAPDGTVTRPATEDTSVTLTATVTLAGQTVTRDFAFTVLADTPQKDLDLVALRFELGITHVVDDLVLRTGVGNVEVRWSSSAPDVVAPDGTVRRQAESRQVTLIADFVRDGLTSARTFDVTVLAEERGRIGAYLRSGDTTRTDVLHLATSVEGIAYTAVNNGRGVLYPTLGAVKFGAPTHFRHPDGSFGLVATENGTGSRIYIYDSADLISYTNERLVRFTTATHSAARVAVAYDNGIGAYRLTYVNTADGLAYEVTTADFISFTAPQRVGGMPQAEDGSFPTGAIDTSSIGVTAAEYERVATKLGRVASTGVRAFDDVSLDAGAAFELPATATVEYSSGSTATMPVEWDADDLAAVDTSKPGTYLVDGTVQRRDFADPLIERRADPDVTIGEDGWYYFTASYPMTRSDDPTGYDRVILRRAQTIDALATATEVTIWHENTTPALNRYIWAPELTKIGDDWYILFTAARTGGVWDIRPAMLKFTGAEFSGDAALDPANWTSLGSVKAAAGDPVAFTSFSLDMTHFEAGGRHYVVWAEKPAGGSTLRMAEIDPANPAQLTSPSILLSSPQFAWEKNAGDSIDEGPAVIQRDGKIYLAFSAGTVDDKYCVGLLTAEAGANLMDPASWTKSGYPLLTTDDVPGQAGPGHNSFTIDEYGNPVIVYHSRTVGDTSNPGEATDGGLYDPRRHTRAALVTWDVDGAPVFNQAPQERLADAHAQVQLRVVVAVPQITATVDPVSPTGAGGWYTGPVTVGLTLDEGSAATIESRVDGGDWAAYEAPNRLDADGVHRVEYRAVVAGAPVEASAGAIDVRIDAAAPTIEHALDPASGIGWTDQPVTASLEAADAASGVDRIEARLDGGTWQTSDETVVFDEVGVHDVEVRAIDAAGNVGAIAAFTVDIAPADLAVRAPATGQLSSDNGRDTGLLDGDYRITMNLWSGENASRFTLYENGVEIDSQWLTPHSPNAQKAWVDVSGRTDGTYIYTGVLTNSKGSTDTSTLTVQVRDANPAKPVLSHDNRDRDGSYTVTANLWWGTNATSYRFFENGVEVASGSLTASTPDAQSARLVVSGKARGTYEYTVEFRNAAGATLSKPITVTVSK
jgi:GH43 family beta-xylosidase